MEEIQHKAKEYDGLKDQLDEYKHAADKLQKAESVIGKYKKKLEEGADLRRKIKVSVSKIRIHWRRRGQSFFFAYRNSKIKMPS